MGLCGTLKTKLSDDYGSSMCVVVQALIIPDTNQWTSPKRARLLVTGQTMAVFGLNTIQQAMPKSNLSWSEKASTGLLFKKSSPGCPRGQNAKETQFNRPSVGVPLTWTVITQNQSGFYFQLNPWTHILVRTSPGTCCLPTRVRKKRRKVPGLSV